MRARRFLFAIGLVLSGIQGGSAAAAPSSIHEQELSRHALEGLPSRVWPSPAKLYAGRMKTVENVVYGYYPYWAHDLTSIRWQALTHMAWFAVEMNSSGGIDATHGWPDAESVNAAHDADVRVDLAFTLFSGSGIKALVTNPTARKTAAKNMVDLMVEGNADGISVDFEGFVDGTRDGFTAFIVDLRAEIDARGLTDKQISLAGPAVDWGSEWDLAKLLDSADYFFIMGYDFFWSGSGYAGPSGILRITDAWSHATSWAALRSIATYASLITPEKRKKIIYGVPYYGREWTTTSGSMAAATLNDIGSVTYSAARDDIASGIERLWDDGSKTPWYKWQSGGAWHQVYYDDEESLAYKYRLARDQDLGGIGMWALNYDTGHEELWDVIEAELGPAAEPLAGHRLNPIPASPLPFHDERDTTNGASQYFDFYGCAPEIPEYGKEWVYRVDVCQPGVLSAAITNAAEDDPDVHLLSDIIESACIARDHKAIQAEVEPGRYYVVVDTFVDGAVEQEGPFALDIDFAPASGSAGCAEHLVCDSGDCVCPEAGQVECDGACVDTSSDPAHCGACDAACEAGSSCEEGECKGGEGAGASASSSGGSNGDEPGAADEGCSCGAAGASGRVSAAASVLAFALSVAARRRRRRERARAFGRQRSATTSEAIRAAP